MKHILITALVFALGFVATSAQADDMLYNDLGGEKGIATIVDNATAAFLADPRIKDTFKDMDFNALVEDLQDGLDASGVDFATQNRLLARLAPMHNDIVTR